MSRDGDNPHSLSVKLSGKTTQPQIYRFLEGITKEPRRSTLQPVADHYGILVEAFYDPKIAAAEAEKLSLKQKPDAQPATPAPYKTMPSPTGGLAHVAHASAADPAAALAVLGQVIAASDKITRAQIKPILDQLLETPEQAPELGQRLVDTLALSQRQDGAPAALGAHQPQQRAA